MDFKRLHRINKANILVFGDFMVDKYIMGEVKRISPEAPVPILEVHSKLSKLGGAGNVINNIISLGGNVKVLGCIGNDADGKLIIDQFRSIGVDISYLRQYDQLQTISKTRLVSKNQQFLRFDEEKIETIPSDYEKYVETNINEILNDINAIIISDYAKGAVTEMISQILITNANLRCIPVIVDPKGKNYTRYRGATVCTPNTSELSLVSNKTLQSEEDIKQYGQKLVQEIDLQYLALTRSEKGISLLAKSSTKKIDFPAVIKDVVDVTGAGDTVVSIISLLLGIGYDIETCCRLANLAASIVCSKFGAATLSLNELMSNILDTGEFKLIDVDTAKYLLASLKEQGKKIIFTNGCFDLLHAGHISSFKQAKKFGDILVVAVNSDLSVKRIKGKERPIIDEENRLAMLCSLEMIDYVMLMEDDNPAKIISEIHPDVCVKGTDWKDKYMPERQIIESYGGKIEFIDLEKGLSTTNIINKICKGEGAF